MSTYRFIAAERAHHSVKALCRVLQVHRSGYHAWSRRPPCARRIQDQEMLEDIRRIHQASRGTYGAPRIWAELRYAGTRTSRRRVAKLMRRGGIQGVYVRRSWRRSRRPRGVAPARDLVRRAFTVAHPDRVWVADITYVPTGEGFLHLAAVMDLHSRKIVGWAMASHLRTELVADALDMAIRRRSPAPGLVHHSDQGTQYCSLAFGRKLQASGIIPSMGHVGTAADNAVVESFFSTLKRELVRRHPFPTRQIARTAMFDWIEVFYNRSRRHSTIGDLAPDEFERTYAAAVTS